MDQLIPCDSMRRLIESLYPTGGRGRPPYPLETMLLHLLQSWYTLSDPAMEEALYDSAAMWGFAKLSRCDSG